MREEFGPEHQLVLQRFVRDVALEEKKVLSAARRALRALEQDESEAPSEEELDGYVRIINRKLKEFAMYLEIRKRRAVELDQKVYWVLVSTKADEIAKSGTDLNAKELVAFKEILKELASSSSGNIRGSEIKSKCSGCDAQVLLDKLLQWKWLVEEEGRSGQYNAGIRTLVELEDTLRDFGAPECPRNKSIIIPTKAYREWFRSATGEDFILDGESGAAGNGHDLSEEEAEEEAPAEPAVKVKKERRSNRQAATRGKRVVDDDDDDDDEDDGRAEEEEEEEEEDDDDDDENDRATSRRGKGKRRKIK